MVKRLVSGVIGIGLFLALCFGGLLPFTLGVTVVAALGVVEWVAAYRRSSKPQHPAFEIQPLLAWCGVVLPLFAYKICVTLVPSRDATALAQAACVGAFALRVPYAGRTGQVLGRARAWYGLVGCCYIGLLFSSFVLLRGLPGDPGLEHARFLLRGSAPDRGAWRMLFVAVCVWATDTGAYLIGRRLGRHKLAPSLSPGKTIEGAVGGLLSGVLAGALFGTWFGNGLHVPLLAALAIGAIAGSMGQVGDLFESALKRELGIKDFGRLMPGHGGVLDRCDSLLFVTPLAYLVLRFLS